MGDLDWLIRRPVAHRGLHDPACGVIENTAPAVEAAIAAGYGIEVDLQLSADGVPMVFHDDTLERLTFASGPLSARPAAELMTLPFRGTQTRMMRLADLLAQVAGRTPLLIELKSAPALPRALAGQVADALAAYAGPAAVMSFDPRLVALMLRHRPGIPRGIVAEAAFDAAEWPDIGPLQRLMLAHLMHWPWSRFQFVAYRLADLDAPAPRLARRCGLPLLTWTVRTPADRARAARRADQIIFEGFRP